MLKNGSHSLKSGLRTPLKKKETFIKNEGLIGLNESERLSFRKSKWSNWSK